MESVSLISLFAAFLHEFPVLSLMSFLAVVMITYYKWAVEPTLRHVREQLSKRDTQHYR